MAPFSFPEECPTCGEPAAKRWDKYSDQTRYRCGTTSMMLAEGVHIENHDPRQEALWKKHLNDTGRRLADPML